MNKRLVMGCLLAAFFTTGFSQDSIDRNFWKISDDKTITWELKNENRLPHSDHIEFSGEKVSAILYYEVDSLRNLSVSRDVIFPQLRTFNKTNEPDWKKYRAYFRKTTDDGISPSIILGDKIIVPSKVDSIQLSGKAAFFCSPVNGIRVTKTFYPSMENRYLVEEWEIRNISNESRKIKFSNIEFSQSQLGYKGKYSHHIFSAALDSITLAPNSTYSFPVYFGATLNDEQKSEFNFETASKERTSFLNEVYEKLQLKTPDSIINTLFYFSKIRAAESIFDSSMGLVHSPGGGNYYTGIWANDQVEYSGPFFPYLGYFKGNVAAFNTYKKFLENIPKDDTHIPYAFEVDGIFSMDHLDRGDAAMIAYGTSLYLLATGSEKEATFLWPLIEWSIEYCHKMRNKAGAVRSESDEMEGRIATGNANLSTSTLYYGGLKYASRLAKELGKRGKQKQYERRAVLMEQTIEDYFGATIEELETYKYFEENSRLRHWICLPLTMGIETRKEGTLQALFEKLWTSNGVLVELNPEVPVEEAIFWDRATLYALRGAMRVGAANLAYDKLKSYSNKRLLGDHVPYPIEAYPENDMQHLSAESALYCRIFTEGLLGIEPINFQTTRITPKLPEDWGFVELKDVFISGKPITISLKRKGEGDFIEAKIIARGTTVMNKIISNGEDFFVKFY
ncbi:six-hairpin glycosidase-like protein [Croceivirga thetidis]|uniref:Six-hairpin glycosidase-like protein n=1 Tax=Croceivirga thetidis TaxID=2721623 RepID=A0ABX1GN25_9FLAO|nr:six-hairpin glycosidase-like protein [Croceivirga thetidis]NKI31034.1 six-hairpin glycosidase-like protein [Croceivirga thetidis]